MDALLETLVRLRNRAGVAVFERALAAARVAIAKVVMAEAERLAGLGRIKREGTIVPFRKRFADRGEPRDEEA
jgi:hypothetical protein